MVAVIQAQSINHQVSRIKNLPTLPARIRDEIQSTTMIQAFGELELTGDDDSGNILWSAEGYWSDNKFIITGYGSHSCHWDGQTVHSTVKVYA